MLIRLGIHTDSTTSDPHELRRNIRTKLPGIFQINLRVRSVCAPAQAMNTNSTSCGRSITREPEPQCDAYRSI